MLYGLCICVSHCVVYYPCVYSSFFLSCELPRLVTLCKVYNDIDFYYSVGSSEASS